jgi:hypothetical protein
MWIGSSSGLRDWTDEARFDGTVGNHEYHKLGDLSCHSPLLRLCSTRTVGADMTQERKIIVHIATSADGYIARPDGNLDFAPRHREVPLTLRSVKPFPDGVVQVHYDIRTKRGSRPKGKV